MVKAALTIFFALWLAACSAAGRFGGRPPGVGDAPSTPAGAAVAVNGADLHIYLQTMRDLIEGDPVVQADVFSDTEAAAVFEPTTTNRLNYALALATPGHPSANAGEAQRLLTELLAAADSLLADERVLAVVHLKEVEQRLILDAEAQRLQQEAAAATTEQNNATTQRLQGAMEENRRLRVQLDEAREKLDAITNIERSIRERESGANPQ